MHRFKLIFLSLILASAFAFFGKGWLTQEKQKTEHHTFPTTEAKSFVIVIPSYNNSKYIEKNLRSVFTQNYKNYRVIYIDDHSSDDTLKKARQLLTELDKEHKATLMHNSSNCGALANIYNAIHTCLDHEIVVPLNGDDYLAHENVLTSLNKAYANPDTWLTLGSCLNYPSFKQHPAVSKKFRDKVIKNRSLRKALWVPPHLRSFYAALFKQINIKDLFYRGCFYSMGWDLGMMLPLLEMGNNHIQFIDEILYLCNRENPISDHKINFSYLQECQTHIRSKTTYDALKHLPYEKQHLKEAADLLIFSNDRPLQLYALLESIERFVVGLNKISVLYLTSSIELESAYLELKLHFPKIQFIKQMDPPNDFKTLCTKIIFNPTLPQSRYILFAPDRLIIKDMIDLSKGIDTLKQTKAFGLYFSLHKQLKYCADLLRHQPIPTHFPLIGIASQETPYAWQFSRGSDDWNLPSHLNFALYRKDDLKEIFNQIDYDSPKALAMEWGERVPSDEIGLFFQTSKCIHVAPEKNLTNKELLEKFNDGLKIDLAPLMQITSSSQKIDQQISFTSKE